MIDYNDIAVKVDLVFEGLPNIQKANYFRPLFMYNILNNIPLPTLAGYSAMLDKNVVIDHINSGSMNITNLRTLEDVVSYINNGMGGELTAVDKKPNSLVIFKTKFQYGLGLLLDTGIIYTGFNINPYVGPDSINNNTITVLGYYDWRIV